jgi:hypothetical protein
MCSHCLFPVVVTCLEQVVCYHLVTRLMTVTDLLQDLYRLFVTSYYELVVNNLLTTCYAQTTSDLFQDFQQLVSSLLAASTLLQDDNNLFQACQQVELRTHLFDKL